MIAVISRVLLFLLRLRFPRNVSIFATIRRRYGDEVTRDFRSWEKATRQATKSELDEVLLRRCFTDSIVPKFLRFKLYRSNLRDTPVYKECQQMLLKNEIDYKSRNTRNLKQICTDLEFRIKANVSFMDFVHMKLFVDKGITIFKKQVTDIHRKKFVSWGGSYNFTNISSDKFIFNYFNRYF